MNKKNIDSIKFKFFFHIFTSIYNTQLQMRNKFIIYQTEDGKVKIETHFEKETVWLNIEQIAELFQKSRSTVNEHILNIFK